MDFNYLDLKFFKWNNTRFQKTEMAADSPKLPLEIAYMLGRVPLQNVDIHLGLL